MTDKEITRQQLIDLQDKGWTYRPAYLDDSSIGSRPNKLWRMFYPCESNRNINRPIVLIRPIQEQKGK